MMTIRMKTPLPRPKWACVHEEVCLAASHRQATWKTPSSGTEKKNQKQLRQLKKN
jgi:hypothetical protein